jgi:hypothetical protein
MTVQALLDSIIENEGDNWISAEQAFEIFGTSSKVRIRDMSERQILQYALLSTYGIAQRLGRTFEAAQRTAALEAALQAQGRAPRLSRAQRRLQERERAKAATRAAKKASELPIPEEVTHDEATA